MLQTNNYFSHIHPADYNPITHPIIYGASSARNTLIHGAVCFNIQMLDCTNFYHQNNYKNNLDKNKALLEGMFAGWVEEWKEFRQADKNYWGKVFENISENENQIKMADEHYLSGEKLQGEKLELFNQWQFEICDTHFVAFGMQAFFSDLDIQNLPFDDALLITWKRIVSLPMSAIIYKISLPHARATVLSNASKFFKVSELPKLNTNLLTVWDSHKNAKIDVSIAHNGTVGCLVDKNGKVRKKAEFGYKSKEAFLLEIQNTK